MRFSMPSAKRRWADARLVPGCGRIEEEGSVTINGWGLAENNPILSLLPLGVKQLQAVLRSSGMEYRCVATSVAGFVQQLVSCYLPHGYWFYVSGKAEGGGNRQRALPSVREAVPALGDARVSSVL